MRRQFADWTLSPDKSSETDSQSITEVHVTAGDHHGKPDTDPHTHMTAPRHANDGVHHAENVPTIDEKAVDAANGLISHNPVGDNHERPDINPHPIGK